MLADSYAYALAVDSSGSAYVGGFDSSCGYLTKLNPTGTAAVWSVCLPVTHVNAVALDSAGNLYVAGLVEQPGELYSTVMMKLTADAQQTLYSTTLLGTNPTGLAVDQSGNAYVTGWAYTKFVATPGAFMTSGGYSFAAKLNSSGQVQYATYLDFIYAYVEGGGIAADSQGDAWVTGASCPDGGTTCQYSSASAIRKLSADGSALLVSKTFGGGPTAGVYVPKYDSASAAAVDVNDSVWVVGRAESDLVPTTPGALEPNSPGPESSDGSGDAYIIKLSASGDLLYGTYLGTTSGGIDSVVVDGQGRPYFGLNSDPVAVTALSADGSSVLFSATFSSYVQAVALDGVGGLYINGTTGENPFFMMLQNTYQSSFPGESTAGFVAKFDLTTQASPSQFTNMVNSASLVQGYNPMLREGAVTPGEIVTVFGTDLPENPTVTFDGRSAPILYSSPTQINAVVPFEVSAPSTVVAVEGTGPGYRLPVLPAVPALFTADGSGYGQLAALNQDGTVNTSAHPAKAGSVVSLWMTGVGAMKPPIADGQLGPLEAPFPIPVLGVSATMNGVEAPVLYIGQAPGLIAGAVQVNLQIPATVTSGNAILIVYIGDYRTQLNFTTIAVQ